MTERFSEMVYLRTDLAARHGLSVTEMEDTLLDLVNLADEIDSGGASDLVRSYLHSLARQPLGLNQLGSPGFEAAPENSVAPPWQDSMRRHVSSGWLTKERDWIVNFRPTESIGLMVSQDSARSGKLGLAVTNHEFSLIYQEVAVEPGNDYQFSGSVSGEVGWASTVALDIAWKNAGGEDLENVRQDRLTPGGEYDWMRLAILGRAPPNAAVARVILRVKFQEPGDFLFADDFAFLELAGP